MKLKERLKKAWSNRWVRRSVRCIMFLGGAILISATGGGVIAGVAAVAVGYTVGAGTVAGVIVDTVVEHCFREGEKQMVGRLAQEQQRRTAECRAKKTKIAADSIRQQSQVCIREQLIRIIALQRSNWQIQIANPLKDLIGRVRSIQNVLAESRSVSSWVRP